MKLSDFTLKSRIQILVTVLLMVTVGGPLFMVVYQMDKIQEELSGNMVESATQLIYRSAFDAFMVRDTAQIQQIIEDFGQRSDIETLRLFRPDGQVVYSSNPVERGKSIFELPEPAHTRDDDANVETFLRDGDMLTHNHPVFLQKECLSCHVHQNVNALSGVLQVQVALPQAAVVYPQLRNRMILGAIFIIVILWVAFNFLYESQIENRLKRIIIGFDKLKRGDLTARVKMEGRHELAHLAERFNETVEALAEARKKEAKLLSENLNHADKLVTLGEVAAEIAHEVNNPVGILRTRAEILKEELEELSNYSAYMEDIEEIIRQSDNIAETTHRILHYARMLPQDFEKVDLRKTVYGAVESLGGRFNEKNIGFDFNADASEAMVLGNPDQLQQALRNLLNNSLDVLDDGGKIWVSLEKHENDRRNKKYFRIIISDNGPGVAREVEKDIFSPFFSTRNDAMHPGLGLFIVRVVVANHHGRVFLENNGTQGARFVIELETLNE